jgi:hypothetical protein
MNQLDLTETLHPVNSLVTNGLAFLAIAVSLSLGFVFGALKLIAFTGVAEWPWAVAIAGLWIPIVVIGAVGITRLFSSRSTVA